jgi:hypothetical protein
MSLEQWLRNGWLQPIEPTIAHIQQSLQVVDRDISDAQAVGLSTDGRFQHAYDAALQLCIIALLAAGYQVRKGEGLAPLYARRSLGRRCRSYRNVLQAERQPDVRAHRCG